MSKTDIYQDKNIFKSNLKCDGEIRNVDSLCAEYSNQIT